MNLFRDKQVIIFSLRYGSFGWGLLSAILFCLDLKFIKKLDIGFAFVIPVLILSLIIGFLGGVIMYLLTRKIGKKKRSCVRGKKKIEEII
jgi:predicted CDP-diglyceride synthetase/phosphatidate cytidylyltransferase